MNHLVKIITSDDGEEVEGAKWCLSVVAAGGNMSFCSGEFYGPGESSCKYKVKKQNVGGITCSECIDKIKLIKSVKL